MRHYCCFWSALLAVMLGFCSSRASAQVIPDTIFDKPPRAFGNTVQDVPPDILSFEVTPKNPGPLDSTIVSAEIWVDPEISKFKVKEAYLYYREVGGKTNMKRVSMIKARDRANRWEATLKGFAAGTEVEFYIRAVDEIGNEVIQIPISDKPQPDDMLPVLFDGTDGGVPATMDILNVAVGYDGKDLFACPRLRRRFQQFSEIGSDAIAVGFIADDVRANPTRSITENTAGFIGYIPAMDIQGIALIEDLTRGAMSRRGDSSAKVIDRRVCMRAPVSKLTQTPERGLKIFAATVGINAFNSELTLGDATPYAIVYFNGGRFSVGK